MTKTCNFNFDWARDMDVAITVCDTQGVIVYQNDRSIEINCKDGRSMVGQSLMPCHNERSRAIIARMLNENVVNVYTITKHGRRKLIFQSPWRVDGKVCGLLELSMFLPDSIPHYDRG